MTKKPRKKNPQDTTFRNLNALKRRVADLERSLASHKVYGLENRGRIGESEDRIANLADRVAALEEWTQTVVRDANSA